MIGPSGQHRVSIRGEFPPRGGTASPLRRFSAPGATQSATERSTTHDCAGPNSAHASRQSCAHRFRRLAATSPPDLAHCSQEALQRSDLMSSCRGFRLSRNVGERLPTIRIVLGTVGAIATHEVTPRAARADPLTVRRWGGMQQPNRRPSRNVSGSAVRNRDPPLGDFFQKAGRISFRKIGE